jgi:acetyl esterase
MAAALTLMAKDRQGPKISYQALLIPANDANVDTESYHQYGTDRFLSLVHTVRRGSVCAGRENAS